MRTALNYVQRSKAVFCPDGARFQRYTHTHRNAERKNRAQLPRKHLDQLQFVSRTAQQNIHVVAFGTLETIASQLANIFI